MKQRFFFAGVLMFVYTLAAFAQNSKSNLAILPFTGGQGNEGETVAELFSFDRQLMNRFGIIPRTSITSAVRHEQEFQMSSGMTDADTINKLGKQLGAQYVMAGSITALGGQKLLVVTIIKIETVQQVAGDHLTYTTENELAGKVSDVVQNLLPMLDVDTNRMEKLAVPPVQLEDGARARDADTLAQILSIALMRNKFYAIYPRTGSLEQVQQEFDTQNSGVTDYRQAAELGKAENPKLVLSVVARRLGTSNRFNASIIDMEYGTLINGTSQEYANMSDGITVMDIIARTLSGQDVSAAEQRDRDAKIAATARTEERERIRAAAAVRRAQARAKFNQKAGLAFALQGGLSMVSKDLVSERIFGEPVPEIEYTTVKDKDTGISSTREKSPSATGGQLDILFGFQYSWFSINTGASFGINYKGPSKMEYSFFQVPLILRADWNVENFINFDIFAGMGYNIPLKAAAALAEIEGGPTAAYSATITIPPSVMVGGGIGKNFGESVVLYADFRGTFDVAETKVKLADGRAGSFKRNSFDIIFGLKYRMSFSKSHR
jgi:TolB-like protein